MKDILLVTCTRLSEDEFWKSSKLAPYIKMQLKASNIYDAHIVSNNTDGIGKCYNRFITEENKDKYILFVHDDIEIYNIDLKVKVNAALSQFDIIGLAGNSIHNPQQSPATWQTGTIDNAMSRSGQVAHEHEFKIKQNNQLTKKLLTTMNFFGPTNIGAKVIDGVFIGVNVEKILERDHKFDEQFDFHFYDLDFSYGATKKGLKVGTWDIYIKHYSHGNYNSDGWRNNEIKYKNKWK